ncbi:MULTISPECIES: TetR/AcrR family transcriptional regulator [Streptomyces]|uniref:TetR family transcriptional regulator n=1 Tax=Streptomyces viridochromogenes TaxID=1938 RepID=A0A0L8KS98_STRVR|nr:MULTISPECIES: TetR/AcrR family transcriptional regulator [Streptomyces]KOG28750.1 TetR family transcriptional regulator [Streptomyces viridochromogenes]
MGLRESKKQETRQLISDCATRLFIEQGFERTTIAEIAAAARVAKKTVTNYFPRKEDLALDHHEAFTQGLAHAVAERAPGEAPLTALGRTFRAALLAHDPVVGFTGPAFARMVADSPTLTARLRELHDQREEALAAALATAADPTPSDTSSDTSPDTQPNAAAPHTAPVADSPSAPSIAPRAAAALIAAADRLLFRRIQELTLAGQDDDRIEATLLPEADHLRALLAAALDDNPSAATW